MIVLLKRPSVNNICNKNRSPQVVIVWVELRLFQEVFSRTLYLERQVYKVMGILGPQQDTKLPISGVGIGSVSSICTPLLNF